MEGVWSTVTKNRLHLTQSTFFGAARQLGWQRLNLDSDSIRQYIISLLPYDDATDIHASWYFAHFILIFAKCAAALDLRVPRIEGWHSGLFALIQVTSDTLLGGLLDRFIHVESETQKDKYSACLGLNVSSLLWMARQGGLIRQASDMLALYPILKKYVNNCGVSLSSVRVPLSSIISLLCEIVKTFLTREQHDFCNFIASFSQFSETSAAATYLALSRPMLLFAEPRNFPSTLASLYSLPSLVCINDMRMTLGRIARRCEVSDGKISVSCLCDLLVSKNVIPNLIRYDAALKMILYIAEQTTVSSAELVSHGSDMTEVDISLLCCTARELYEIIFYLSQIVFSTVESDIIPCLVLERQVRESDKWEWVVKHIIASSACNTAIIPKIAIQDEVDRFYCLLEICDPDLNGEDFVGNMCKTLAEMTTQEKVAVVPHASLHKTLSMFREFIEEYVAKNWSPETAYNLRHRLALPLMSTVLVHLLLHFSSERIVFPWTFFAKICEAHANFTRHIEEDFACVIMEEYASLVGNTAGDIYDFVMSVLLRTESALLDEGVCCKLVKQALSLFYTIETQNLLELSKDTLFCEYMRCCCTLSATQKGPFLDGVGDCIPSYYCYLEYADTMAVTRIALIEYLKNRFPEVSCEKLFDFIEALYSTKTRIGFSLFVFLLIHCNSNSLSLGGDEYTKQTNSTLAIVSAEYERNTKLYGISFVHILMSGPSKRSKLSPVEEEVLLKLALQHFNGGVQMDTSTAHSRGLPPSPPQELWDAPRFMQFCKVYSIPSLFNSMLHVWKTFGRVLVDQYSETRLAVWDDSVVGPLPVLIDYDKLGLTLSKLIIAVTVSKHAKHLSSLHFTLSTMIAPRLAGAISSGTNLLSNMSLENMLRYGGDRVMNSLDMHYIWISEIFDHLTNLGDTSEPQVLSVCRYIASIDVINLGQVSLLAKHSLLSRMRQSLFLEPKDVTMCRPEFEELLLRCAFVMWEKAGGLSIDAQKGEVPSMLQRNSSGNDEAVRKYNTECENMLFQLPSYKKYRKIQTKSASKSTLRSWGVDFLSPFLLILKLFAQFPQSTSLKKPFVPDVVALQMTDAPVQASSQIDNTLNNVRKSEETRALPNSPETSPEAKQTTHRTESPSRLPLPSAAPTKMLHQPEVKHRSNELLTSILAMRNNSGKSSTTPPRPSRKEEKLIVHDLSPTVRVLETRVPTIDSPVHSPLVPYTSELVESTKEALWPVFATYCSCGDSLEPGKLSGPNLLALLSKLNLLDDNILLSDVILLFHRISAHSLSISPVTAQAAAYTFDDSAPPLFTFEEFLVYLCAFAMLKFEMEVKYPECRDSDDYLCNGDVSNSFLNAWMKVMETSKSFSKLMIDFVLPRLRKQSVLASPQDARHRDLQVILFSLDIVFHVERVEEKLRDSFFCQKNERLRFKGDASQSSVKESFTDSLQRIRIVPHILSVSLLNHIICDILPSESGRTPSDVTFPQYEWLVCVVAFSAVHASAAKDLTKVNSQVVGEIIETLITAILDTN